MESNMKNSSMQSTMAKAPDIFHYCADVPGYFYMHHNCTSNWVTNVGDSHTHVYCEILLYVQSMKCLFVNDTMYVSQSPCFFTFRPGEYHYAIHDGSCPHELYMIHLFQDSFFALPGGRELLRCLFDRETAMHNMIILPEDDQREAFRLLNDILLLEKRGLPEQKSLMLADMLLFLGILNRHYLSGLSQHIDDMSERLRQILAYIGNNLTEPLKVSELAKKFNISQSAMERMFRNSLTMLPREYIIRRRMDAAREFLRQGQSVTDACNNAGFGDYSHFIADFRRFYGITPAEYAKQHRHEG